MPATLISLHPTNDHDNPPDEAEARVAEALLKLGDGFVIRWGFYYSDETGAQQGEGDFLVLGPDGNVLHLEVKSGPVTFDPRTRRFLTADGSNPILQRDQIWAQVVRVLNKHAREAGLHGPFVQRVVALPDVTIPPDAKHYQTMPRSGLLDSGDLENLQTWWRKHFKVNGQCEERRQVFLSLYAPGIGQEITRHTLDFTDRIIERHTAATFDILDAVGENHQLLFTGGPGTGKTWFALEQAFRWAREDLRVLFLTYNLELAGMLAAVVQRKNAGGIEVYSYEALAEKLYATYGQTLNAPDHSDREACQKFFDVELPRKLLELTEGLPDDQKFDALVVDEAQDHNTSFHPEVGAAPEAAGWWEIYARLLRRGKAARVAAFCDERQRHFARGNLFDAARLDTLFEKITRVRLRRTMRYTRQLRDFLRGIDLPNAKELLQDLSYETALPEGPEPEFISANSPQKEKSAVGRVVGNWVKTKACRAEDVLILYPTTAARPTWLDNPNINGVALAKDGKPGIRASSVHKAKGLEALAVVLVGFPPVAELKKPGASEGAAFTWLMGATRARQLLAVIERTDIAHSQVQTL
jgi:hypothetical protein